MASTRSKPRQVPASDQHATQVVPFQTVLGWCVLVGEADSVRQLVWAYPSRAAALAAVDEGLLERAGASDDWQWLVERLKQYASGQRVEFGDVKLDLSHLTDFQRRVVKHCRAIHYGQTRGYQQLGEKSGSPRAARAVGSTMAANRFPILVPCHRVINSDGSVGAYSAPDGVRAKVRLLELEQATLAAIGGGGGSSRRGISRTPR
jgi:methylated-DNA-[protein]-cysteine S-methyltransferase